jgi:hypothetical protein
MDSPIQVTEIKQNTETPVATQQKKKRGRPVGATKYTPQETRRRLHFNNARSTVKNINKLNMTLDEMKSLLAVMQQSEIKLMRKIVETENNLEKK